MTRIQFTDDLQARLSAFTFLQPLTSRSTEYHPLHLSKVSRVRSQAHAGSRNRPEMTSTTMQPHSIKRGHCEGGYLCRAMKRQRCILGGSTLHISGLESPWTIEFPAFCMSSIKESSFAIGDGHRVGGKMGTGQEDIERLSSIQLLYCM